MCVIRFTKIILVFLGLVGLMGCNKQSDLDLAQTSNEYAISFTAEGVGPELRVAGLPSIPVGSDGRKISKLLADDITQVPVHCIFRNSIGESFANPMGSYPWHTKTTSACLQANNPCGTQYLTQLLCYMVHVCRHRRRSRCNRHEGKRIADRPAYVSQANK